MPLNIPNKVAEFHDGCDHYEAANPKGTKHRIKDAISIYCNGALTRWVLVPCEKGFAVRAVFNVPRSPLLVAKATTAVKSLKKFSILTLAERRDLRLNHR